MFYLRKTGKELILYQPGLFNTPLELDSPEKIKNRIEELTDTECLGETNTPKVEGSEISFPASPTIIDDSSSISSFETEKMEIEP